MVIKIEIWSDIACPFCYIGKRKFEQALAKFEHKDKVEVEWKSFLLDPNKVTDPTVKIKESLAKRKGISIEEAEKMSDYVTQAARPVGLDYNFDKMIVANTFKSHRLLHFAKTKGKQNELKEALLKAYFLDGKNIDDNKTLTEIAIENGLNNTEVEVFLNSTEYTDQVNTDISEAQEIGVQGVPFFVFNRKFAVSGAQDSEVMLNTLEKAYSEAM
jgi:predicted DsbA family dithiol-disulfide isomerase